MAVYEAIPRLAEGDVLATRGLGLALIKLSELGRAQEIVEEALILHPEDKTLLARAEDICRANVAGMVSRVAVTPASAGVSLQAEICTSTADGLGRSSNSNSED